MAVSNVETLIAPGPRAESSVGHVKWYRRAFSGRLFIYEARLLVLVAIIAAWQYVPDVHAISERYRFLDRFFISSPPRVGTRFWDYMIGAHGYSSIWPNLIETLTGALEGFVIGSILGFVAGLVLSNSERLNDVLGVFVVAMNSVPKVAILPIIVIIVGVGSATVVVSSAMVVFFITFFNCLEGGRSVPPAMFENAQVFGASRLMTMTRIRARYVQQWAFASLPNALAYCVSAAVTVQILAGNGGIGGMIQHSVANLDATGTITLAVYLGITGTLLLRVGELVKRRVLHWADGPAGGPH